MIRLLFGSLLAASLMLGLASTTAREKPAFVPIFNGKDFTGWSFFSKEANSDAKKTWSIVDGELRCTGKPNGYILTEKEYQNYTVKLKWRFPAGSSGGNSGLLVHCTGPNRIWPHSIEAQLKSGFAGEIWLVADEKGQLPTIQIDAAQKDPANKQGRRFLRLTKEEQVEKPIGEWNEMLVMCQDGAISIEVNGKFVNHCQGGSLKKGRIALQSEGAEIHFKDIQLAEFK